MHANPPTGKDTVLLSFEKGPGIDIHRMAITGPLRLIEDVEEAEQKRITERFLGKRGERDQYAEAILRPLIIRLSSSSHKEQVEKYLNMALRHQAKGHRFEDGIHLALRACSVPKKLSLPRTAWSDS